MVFRRLVKLYGEGGIYVRGGLDSGEPPAGGGGQKTHARNINRNLHAVNFILLLLLLSILMNLYLNILFSEQTGLWRGGLQMLLRHSQSGGLYNFLCSCL
jgi:hypothetical protein